MGQPFMLQRPGGPQPLTPTMAPADSEKGAMRASESAKENSLFIQAAITYGWVRLGGGSCLSWPCLQLTGFVGAGTLPSGCS